jgi:hypothetical protein
MLLNVAITLAAADQAEAAFDVIEEIEQPWDKTRAIADVGEVLVRRDSWVSVAPLLVKARAIDELFARVRGWPSWPVPVPTRVIYKVRWTLSAMLTMRRWRLRTITEGGSPQLGS